MPKNIRDIEYRNLKIMIAAVIAVGLGVMVYVFLLVKAQSEKSLLQNTDIVAQLLDGHSPYGLKGTADDANKQEYQTLKNKLMNAAGANPDIRFIYLLGQRQNGKIFFFADSEPEDSPELFESQRMTATGKLQLEG